MDFYLQKITTYKYDLLRNQVFNEIQMAGSLESSLRVKIVHGSQP